MIGKRILRSVGIGLVVAVSAVATTQAATQSQLLNMLEFVPYGVQEIATGWAHVRYVDYAALFASEGLAELRALGSVDLLLTTVPLGALVGRVADGPDALQYLLVSAGRMTEVVGFEWLTDVDRSLEFGEVPAVGLLLGGSLDPDAIGRSLETRGFDRRDIGGVEVWHRFDDWTIRIDAREPADPFAGHLGSAARIALLPDVLASGRAWGIVEATLAALQGDILSLADDPGHRALIGSLTGPEGLLIQALLFPGEALRLYGESWPIGDTADRLPPYTLAGLADRQEGGEQVHVISLVYPDGESAQLAARVLARRIEAFALPEAPEDPLVERVGATITAAVVEHAEDGLAVAVVEARYPLPHPRRDAQTGTYLVAGELYRLWVRAILFRAFSPLW